MNLAHGFFWEGSPKVHEGGEGAIFKIGFGSCYDGLEADKRAPTDNILSDIVRENLDLWVWLGDFAYVDKKVLKRRSSSLWERVLHLALKVPLAKAVYQKVLGGQIYVHEDDRRHLFNRTYSNECKEMPSHTLLLILRFDSVDYQSLRARVPVVGVWDDHDYGINDGDATYKWKVP
jgi:hypothetical protein